MTKAGQILRRDRRVELAINDGETTLLCLLLDEMQMEGEPWRRADNGR